MGLNLASILGEQYDHPSHLPNAVVGIVDIVNSTIISEKVSIEVDWAVKREFNDIAKEHAFTQRIMMLNSTGDGFVFLVNPKGESDWAERLARFHELMVRDFRELLRSCGREFDTIRSGLRFGIAIGPILIESERADESFAAVTGRVVNMAARLCACAKIDGLVVDQIAATTMRFAARTLEFTHTEEGDLKGFEGEICRSHFALKTESRARNSRANDRKAA